MQQSIEDEGNVKPQKKQGALSPFRRAVLRGMGILMPPLLTVVLFIWKSLLLDIIFGPTKGDFITYRAWCALSDQQRVRGFALFECVHARRCCFGRRRG